MSCYKLVKVIDSGSQFKSEIAKMIVSRILFSNFDIEYDDNYNSKSRCQNSMYDKKTGKTWYCNVEICDIFIVENDDGERFDIGNVCIGKLVNENRILNLDKEKFKFFKSLLKQNSPCILCGRGCKNGIHKKCLMGNKNDVIVDLSQINKMRLIMIDIQIQHCLKLLSGIMDGVELVKRSKKYNEPHLKTLEALKLLIKENELLIKNKGILLDLKNNCLIESIKKQSRPPSVKQYAVLQNILDDYDRIKLLDAGNTNKTYIKYGFTYKKKIT
jgi:hypothetical protein